MNDIDSAVICTNLTERYDSLYDSHSNKMFEWNYKRIRSLCMICCCMNEVMVWFTNCDILASALPSTLIYLLFLLSFHPSPDYHWWYGLSDESLRKLRNFSLEFVLSIFIDSTYWKWKWDDGNDIFTVIFMAYYIRPCNMQRWFEVILS